MSALTLDDVHQRIKTLEEEIESDCEAARQFSHDPSKEREALLRVTQKQLTVYVYKEAIHSLTRSNYT